LGAEQDESALPSADIQQADEPAEEFEGKSDDEILSILELPDPETLTLGDTVEKFMDGRVPERIRARALRAFWKTNPVLANLDGLDEYWDDYTDAAMIVEDMQTLYQVGKGYASQALDALESLAEDEGQVDETISLDSVDQTISDRRRLGSPVDNERLVAHGETGVDSADLQQEQEQEQEQPATLLSGPRRMTFS